MHEHPIDKARTPTIAEQRYSVGVNPDHSLKVTDDVDTLAPDVRAVFTVVLPAGTFHVKRWANLMRGMGHRVCIDTASLFHDYTNRQS